MEHLGAYLQAVADPENGHAKLKDVGVYVGGIVVINRIWRAREDDTCERRSQIGRWC
jgi:hypothetical protein